MASEAANKNAIYIPPWMMAPGAFSAPSQAATEQEWAAWEKAQEPARKREIEERKKVCQDIALGLQAIPIYGQLAAGPVYAACLKGAETRFEDRAVFGPVKVDDAYLAEIKRGAPKAPTPPIIDSTPEKERAYKVARDRYMRSYALWKEEDLRRLVPDISRAEWDVMSAADRKLRVDRVMELASASNKVSEPRWLRMVLVDRAAGLLAQLKEWTTPLPARLLGLVYPYRYIIGLTAAATAAAAALAGHGRRLAR